MPKVIGVRFRTSPRIYFFAPNDSEEYDKGQVVVVETQRGVEMATVIQPPHEVGEEKIVAPLKPILRIATETDLEAERADNAKKRDILATVKEKVAAHGLDMKVCDCEFTVDHSKLVLYFTAEQRVDFRDLVRDLASTFHIRIDLRQIGPREECKLVGSLGSCGQPCCCGRFESDNEHVSIKMAKNQNLALTPNKINGMCGRLLCCLAYENRTYEDVAKRAPKVGTIVGVPDGRRGVVQSVTPLTETVRVKIGGDDNFELVDYKIDELSFDKGKPERPEPENRGNKPSAENGGRESKKDGKDENETKQNAPSQPNRFGRDDKRINKDKNQARNDKHGGGAKHGETKHERREQSGDDVKQEERRGNRRGGKKHRRGGKGGNGGNGGQKPEA